MKESLSQWRDKFVNNYLSILNDNMKQYHKYYQTSVSLTFVGKVTLTEEAYAHAINMPVHGGNSFLYIEPVNDKFFEHLVDNKMTIEQYNELNKPNSTTPLYISGAWANK